MPPVVSATTAQSELSPSALPARTTPAMSTWEQTFAAFSFDEPIKKPAANDDYFDPGLEARLQSYRSNNEDRFSEIGNSLTHDVIKTPGRVFVSSRSNEYHGASFINLFRPDTWTFQSNFRREAPYYASDVAVTQYTLAAEAGGFMGQLPKKLSESMSSTLKP